MKNTTRRLTTAQALVEFLKNQFVERDGQEHRLIQGVFGIFGHGNVAGLGQALEELGGKDLPFYQPKNEQAMVHTSVAFAKARRGLGTFACTTSVGPGATNMVTGAATATINRLPVLLLPGDTFAQRWVGPVLQQLEFTGSQDVSVNDAFRPVSRYWDRIQRPEQILTALPEAMRHLATPELMGAVTICLPEDVQAEAYDFPENFFQKRVYRQRRTVADSESLAQAEEWLRLAERPLVVAGGGVFYSEAETVLQKWVERTGVPVAVTQAGKGVLADLHSLNMGGIGVTGTEAANTIAEKADLVLCLGTRLSDFTTASKTQFQNPKVRFVQVNVSGVDAHKHGGLPLVADAKTFLEGFGAGYQVSSSYAREIAQAKESWLSLHRSITHPQHPHFTQLEALRVFNEFCDPHSTIVHAAGGLPGDLHKLWLSKSPGDYHSEYGYSCMGYEIAGALGVKMAHPEREVYAFLGDGSYLMMNHEIVTSLQEQKKITIVLLDNHGYQCIHNLQKSCGSPSFGNEFRNRDGETKKLQGSIVMVDYVANARSLGAQTFVAQDEKSFREALVAARKETGTCLIYAQVDPSLKTPGYSWWDVPVAEVSNEVGVQEAREKYLKYRKKQTFYY